RWCSDCDSRRVSRTPAPSLVGTPAISRSTALGAVTGVRSGGAGTAVPAGDVAVAAPAAGVAALPAAGMVAPPAAGMVAPPAAGIVAPPAARLMAAVPSGGAVADVSFTVILLLVAFASPGAGPRGILGGCRC